ncbi:HAD family hydrolase [Candidatus Enterococcus murrayae]|uniref:HAD family hydrolase n=1 Tax=Candidatus Enterococcus murrayae TaxID=2815321 RepID=A0ABS3HMP7_9ENTE|nr:HAD family hydrolase [Enterococcus sp. MJM16]MBO0454736.1 HAD family hydrolase [Enterococcus sp. MJM16]
MIQGIVFDLDDTLYEQQAPFAAAINSLFPTFPANKMNSLFIRFRYYSDFHYMKSITGEWSLKKMRYERIRLALADFDFTPADAELDAFQTAYDRALQTISLPVEVHSALDFLVQQKVLMGIITNGPVRRQEDKLNALHLTDWIAPEKILISDGVQIQKPDPKIFKLMEERLDLTNESLLYIGDSFDNDVIGAKAAGWSVWWFNHQRRAIPSGQTAIFDEEITSFSDLNKALTTKMI